MERTEISKNLLLILLLPTLLAAWTPLSDLNSHYQDFGMSVSPDGRTMIFSSDRPGGQGGQDLWMSTLLSNGQWTKPANLTNINSPEHDQQPFFTYDGSALLFSSDREGGFGASDIYLSLKSSSGWTPPTNLGPQINTPESEKMPSLSMDSKELFFCRSPVDYRTLKVDHGKISILVTTLKKGKWKEPRPLPQPVNMGKYDCAPKIMPDNTTLFFSSGRAGGKGGLDIWSVRRTGPGKKWERLANELEVNTPANEAYITFSIDGKKVFVSSADKRNPKYDLYEKILDRSLAEPTFTLLGRVTNIRTGKPVRADIICEVIAEKAEKISVRCVPGTGEYSISLRKGLDYSLTVEAPEYLFHSQRIDLTGLRDSTALPLNIGLQPLNKGEILVVQTIYFDADSDTIRPESLLALNRVADILRKNPRIKLLITGHVADVNAPKETSQKLSEKRADSVKEYLVSKKIDSVRLQTKGMGSTKPIGDNKTEKGRELNRRTEFEIISD